MTTNEPIIENNVNNDNNIRLRFVFFECFIFLNFMFISMR